MAPPFLSTCMRHGFSCTTRTAFPRWWISPPSVTGWPLLAGDPARVNPVIASEMVVDHSVIADVHGTPDALARNVDLEYARNGERYRFLRWGQQSLKDFAVVPPGTGIMHQVNLEHLARVVMTEDGWAFPDVCLGTDSHTTMINGLGVLGWGIGGIEAEAAMLGQSISINVPGVVGVYLRGALPAGSTATDLVLTITERLRATESSASSSSSQAQASPTFRWPTGRRSPT